MAADFRILNQFDRDVSIHRIIHSMTSTRVYTSLLYNLVLKRIFFVFLRLQRNTGLFCITDKH